MRPSLLVAALLLVPAFTLLPGVSATECGGIVDADCDSTYCTENTTDGCFHRENVHCIVYLNPGRPLGDGENFFTVVCYLLSTT